jgi:hypothetical protein
VVNGVCSVISGAGGSCCWVWFRYGVATRVCPVLAGAWLAFFRWAMQQLGAGLLALVLIGCRWAMIRAGVGCGLGTESG